MSQDSILRMKIERIDAATVVEREPLLDRSPLVRALGVRREEVLREAAGMQRLAAGATVFLTGDAADRVYLVARGEVAILTGAGADAAPIATLSTGDCFGAGAALEGAPRSVTARAVSQVDLVVLSAERLARLRAGLPALGAYLEQIHDKLAGAKDEFEDFLSRW